MALLACLGRLQLRVQVVCENSRVIGSSADQRSKAQFGQIGRTMGKCWLRVITFFYLLCLFVHITVLHDVVIRMALIGCLGGLQLRLKEVWRILGLLGLCIPFVC